MATTSYSQGWLAGVTWTQNSQTTPILSAVNYSGPAGAFGAITSANVGQSAGAALYHYAAQLDSDGRLVADDLVKISSGAMLYDEQLSYDPVGNISAVTTILPAGTDHQLFCYDEQNRLTWAGTDNPTTGNPCGNGAATGSFGGASYTQSFSYDTLNRLTSGPLGNYTYGDTNHLHAATSVSSGYTASYDAAGDMQCRAPSSSTTCSGTKTGQSLTWDVEGRLATWQNTTNSPTVTANYLYDGEGNRVEQQVTDSTAGTTTTTSYVGSLETYSITTSNGPTAITTTDYISAGKALAESVNGTLSYLATSYQGSVVAALDSTGAVGVTASQLYAPYGGVRYASGTMATDYGYTGQRADASTGLDYYGARYYDPTLGQFTSADTLLAGGLNRYGYVSGNPSTATDPSGHMDDEDPDEGGATGDQGMTPEAMSGDVSPGGDAVVSDGDVSPVNPAIDDSPQDITDDNGPYAGDPVTLDGTPDDGTATIHESDGDTVTESQADFWETQGSVDNLDEPTEMGRSAYTSQEQENQQTTTTPTTPTSENPDNPSDTGGKGGNGGTGTSGPTNSNIVYRGLATDDNPANGFTARDPDAVDVDLVSHVAGKRNSPWISTTRDPDAAIDVFGKQNGVAAIDLSKVDSQVVDYSSGIPGREGQMISNWAAKYSEVLVFQQIPPEAILWWCMW